MPFRWRSEAANRYPPYIMRGLVAVGVYRIHPPMWSRWCRAVFTRAGEQLRSEGGASTSNTSHGNTRDDVRWYRQLRDGYFLREVLWGATCAALGALVFALVGTRNDNDGNARQREKLSESPQQQHAASLGSERADVARDGSETNSSHLQGANKGASDAQSADRALYAFIPASIHASELLAGLLPQVRQLWQQVAVDLSNAAAPQLPRSFSPTSVTDEMQPSSSERQLAAGSRSMTAAVGEDGDTAGRGAVLGRYFIADAAAKAAPVVVNITTTFRGENKSIQGRCAGSGFLIHPDGTIITNAHVVDERLQGCTSAKREILVHLQDGRAFSGEVRNIDRHSDIAVVKVSSDEQLPAAQLGSSSALRAGEWVVALGSPLELHNSVTAGIVSCVERRGSDMGLVSAESSYFDYIQTDCSINKGNSGGPLVDLDGRVVGVSTMKALAANGISFAIPIDSVKDILEQFEKHGRVIRPYVGIQMLELSPAIVRQLQRRDRQFPSVSGGILVPTVFPGSPADRAGMQVGDIITGCNGVEGPLTVAVLVQRLAKNVSSPTKLAILRDGRPLTLTVEAVESPP